MEIISSMLGLGTAFDGGAVLKRAGGTMSSSGSSRMLSSMLSRSMAGEGV